MTDPEAYLNEQFELALALCEEPYAQLSAAANTWDTEHLAYLDGMEQYQKGEQEFSQKSAEYQEKLALYEAGLADYQKGLAEYEQARSRLDAGWAEYQTALAQLRKGQQELHEGEQEYSSKQQEYQDGLSALDDGKRQYAQGQKALRDGKAALEDGDSRYESGLAEYESGAAELAEAQADLDALPDCRWVILDVEGNASYLAIQNGVKNVSDMGITFSICIKEYLSLKRYGERTNEYRVFYINGEIATISRNSGQGVYTPLPSQEMIESYKNLGSPYYTLDYAELEDGTRRILEAGDGQVSDLSDHQDYHAYFRTLHHCFN